MRDRVRFGLYIAAVFGITMVHEMRLLVAGMGIVILLSGRDFRRIARKAALAIVFFNSIVTVSYVLVSVVQGNFSGYYVALINMRVFLLTSLTFLARERIDPFRVVGFSRSLSYFAVIAYGQVLTLTRFFQDFRQALRSRSIRRLSVGDLVRHNASLATSLLRKSVHDTSEIAHAMRSRGFFDD